LNRQSFSLYIERPSALHRLHPLTSLTFTGLLLVSGLVLPGLWSAYVVFGLVVLPLALVGRIAVPLLRTIAAIILPYAVSLLLVQGIFFPGGETPLFYVGPVSFKAEGLAFAAKSAGRILLIVSSFGLLSLTTRPDALMTALTERGFPHMIAYIVTTTIQIVPRFQAKAQAILDAQQARGLETKGSIIRRLRALLPLVGPLILGSILEIEERAIALEARGFSRQAPKTSMIVLEDAAWQVGLRWLMIALMVGLVGFAIFRLIVR